MTRGGAAPIIEATPTGAVQIAGYEVSKSSVSCVLDFSDGGVGVMVPATEDG